MNTQRSQNKINKTNFFLMHNFLAMTVTKKKNLECKKLQIHLAFVEIHPPNKLTEIEMTQGYLLQQF